MSVTVEITNLNDVQTFLDNVPKRLADKAWEILKAAASVCMDHAKHNSPAITGRYRSSIHVEKHGDQSYDYADDFGNKFQGGFSEKPSKDEIFVGTNVIYAGKVEQKHHTLDNARIQAQFYLTTQLDELTR